MADSVDLHGAANNQKMVGYQKQQSKFWKSPDKKRLSNSPEKYNNHSNLSSDEQSDQDNINRGVGQDTSFQKMMFGMNSNRPRDEWEMSHVQIQPVTTLENTIDYPLLKRRSDPTTNGDIE